MSAARSCPAGSAMSDTHGELYFARYDARHRLVTGGALLNPKNGAERLKPYIAARLERLFPQIGTAQFDYVWNGTIGMTRDYLPRFHRLGPTATPGLAATAAPLAFRSPLGASSPRDPRHPGQRTGPSIHRP